MEERKWGEVGGREEDRRDEMREGSTKSKDELLAKVQGGRGTAKTRRPIPFFPFASHTDTQTDRPKVMSHRVRQAVQFVI